MNSIKIVKIHKTLSDKTRWEIFSAILSHPNLSGKELLTEFKITQPTLSFHLNKLEQSGLVNVKKIGQSHYYHANIPLLEETVKYGQQALTMIKKSR